MKLPTDVERIFGMIKAKGISVTAKYDLPTLVWDITIGDKPERVTHEALGEFAKMELKKLEGETNE